MRHEFFIKGPLPNLNDILDAAKANKHVYAKLKETWTDAVAWAAKASRAPKFGRVWLSFRWQEPNQKRDPDNVAAGKKFILDGLKRAGVLSSDGWKQVAGWADEFVVEAGEPGCRVTITEVP